MYIGIFRIEEAEHTDIFGFKYLGDVHHVLKQADMVGKVVLHADLSDGRADRRNADLVVVEHFFAFFASSSVMAATPVPLILRGSI